MEAYTGKPKNEIEEKFEEVLRTPKRKKTTLLSTGIEKYLQTLFLEKQHSDITICMLGEEFNLHKILLLQSPYFACMFNGPWVERTKGIINIELVDSFITKASLKKALGSLYKSKIGIKTSEVVSILATAMMFQLNDLIEKCTDLMIKTINPRTVWNYYDAGCRYAIKEIEDDCFEWFLANLVMCSKYILDLKNISIPLMTKLMHHPELVVDSENSTYKLLKSWIYLQTDKTFGTEELSFLETPNGQQYTSVFEGLRLQNMMIIKNDLNKIVEDNIIPKNWIFPIILKKLNIVLEIKNQQQEIGPGDVSDEIFLKTSLRYGFFIEEFIKNPMRHWKIPIVSSNLLLMINGSTLSIKRQENLLCFQGSIHIILRLKIMKLNKQRQIENSQQSEILRIALRKDFDSLNIMFLKRYMESPLLISIHILDVTSKLQETLVENRQSVP